MKPMKKIQQDRSTHSVQHQATNDAEEVAVPNVAALAGILLTGLLYLVLPPDVIVGPNCLLLVIEGVFGNSHIQPDGPSCWSPSASARWRSS